MLKKRCFSFLRANTAKVFLLFMSSSVSGRVPRNLQLFHEVSPFLPIVYIILTQSCKESEIVVPYHVFDAHQNVETLSNKLEN